MRRTWGVARLVAISLLLTGCAVLPMNKDYAGPQARPGELLQFFARSDEAAAFSDVTEAEESRNDDFVVTRVQIPAAASRLQGLVEEVTHAVTIDFYDPAGEKPAPVIICLPTLGGDNQVARHFAKVFVRRGFAAAIVHRQEQYKQFDRLELLNPTFEQIVDDHRLAIDWLVQNPAVDAERIGLFGVSAGAIKGAIVLGVEPRIKASFLGLVGGDLGNIFAVSREKGIARNRREIIEREHVTSAQIEADIDAEFKHDPLTYAPYVNARNTLLVLSRFDAVVPYVDGLKLREAMGGPRTIVLPTGHYGAILYVPYLEGVAAGWFEERLRGEE